MDEDVTMEEVFYNRGFSDSDSDEEDTDVTDGATQDETDDTDDDDNEFGDFAGPAVGDVREPAPLLKQRFEPDVIVEDDTGGYKEPTARIIPNIKIIGAEMTGVADILPFTRKESVEHMGKTEGIYERKENVQIIEPMWRTDPDILVEDYDTGDSIETAPRAIPRIKVTGGPMNDESDVPTDTTAQVAVEDEDIHDDITMLTFDKKTRPAMRNFSEVFTKRSHPAERMSSVPNMRTNKGLTATRSSLSRQGSHVQDVPRDSIQTQVAANDKTDAFLQSSTCDEERSRRLKALLDVSWKMVQKHKTKATLLKLNIRSNAFDKAYGLLKENRLVHITGKVGCGKTHTALDTIASFTEEFENYKPLFIRSPLDLVLLENTALCTIVFADGVVSTENCQNSIASGWRHVIKYVIPLIERKRICFVFTSEEVTGLNKIAHETHSLHGLLDKHCVINLDDDDECSFSNKHLNKMLTVYCKHFCKPLYTHPKEIEDYVLAHNSSVGFPLICSLVGIGGSTELFSNPYGALCSFVAEQYEHHFPSYFLLVLVLMCGKDCSLMKFQYENQSTFEKLGSITKNLKSTYSEVSIGLTRLKRQHVLFEEESGTISFTHELIAAAVFSHVFTTYAQEQIIELLPAEGINTLILLPGSHFGDNNGSTISSQIENSTEALRAVVSNFSNTLDSKHPEDFLNVASSYMWSLNAFVNTIFTVLGCQFFFIEDLHKTPLSSYLVRLGNISVIYKVVEFLRSQPCQIISMSKPAIEKTKEEACRFNEEELFKELHTLSSSTDTPLVHAAIEGGNVATLALTMKQNTNSSIAISRDMLQLSCKYGNLDVMRFLFSKLETRHDSSVSRLLEMRKQNIKGETLLHYASLGGNVSVFDFLLEQRCDPQSRTHEGNSVLHIAAMFGRLQMVRLICSRFPELLREKNQHDFTCVHLAAREGHDDVLQILVARESNVTDRVKGGNTVLHLAAANAHSEIIRYTQLVNPMQQFTGNDSSLLPVHLALKNGSIDSLKQFLKNGCDIGTKTVDKRSLLHLAAFYGQLEPVKFLCSIKPELLKEVDIEGNTAGHDAAAGGNISVLKYLTDKGVDPLSQNKFKTTLLHEATFHGHLTMVKYLHDNYPALLTAVNTNGYTVCFGAALSGTVEILNFLISNGADPKASSVEDSTILHEAAFAGKLEVVQYLCTCFPELKDVRNKKTYMPCHFAAQEGHLEVLDALLSDVTMPLPTTSEHQTLLHIAAYNGMVLIVKYLCKKYPTIVPCVDKENASALHYAARGGYKEVLQHLVDEGLDPESSTTSGSTILHLAAYDGNTDMVTYLCSKYPQLIQRVDLTGYNAAHYGAGSGEVPLLLNILKYGLDPLLRSSNGSTLLLKAAYNGKMEMVQYLCTEHTELIAMADAFGCNVLHYAACGGNTELIRYLVDIGVDPQSTTNDGHTVLHVAAFHGQAELVHHICQTFPELLNKKDYSGKTAAETAIQHKSTKIIHVLESFKTHEDRTDEHTSTGIFTDVCCCEGTSFSDRFWRIFGRILCCCRR